MTCRLVSLATTTLNEQVQFALSSDITKYFHSQWCSQSGLVCTIGSELLDGFAVEVLTILSRGMIGSWRHRDLNNLVDIFSISKLDFIHLDIHLGANLQLKTGILQRC